MATKPGWAIRRNGSCLLMEEVDCGETATPYRACCPSSTTCPSHTQYNTACCPVNMNCTAALVETPSCANHSWTMFDNGGYFCCERGQVGYDIQNTDGCSISGEALPRDAVPLAVIDQAFPSTSKSTSVVPTSPVPTPSSSGSPSNNAPGGTIAGAALGGVAGVTIIAGVLWFIFRRKKTSLSASATKSSQNVGVNSDERHQEGSYSATPMAGPAEIAGTPKAELWASIDHTEGRSEMP
ncbi:hypothetical protein F5X97DRAFT_282356 [Nemania serpens]|nr:hypothetical protein F5X97DRAFT_282356 [Nemania serpens]